MYSVFTSAAAAGVAAQGYEVYVYQYLVRCLSQSSHVNIVMTLGWWECIQFRICTRWDHQSLKLIEEDNYDREQNLWRIFLQLHKNAPTETSRVTFLRQHAHCGTLLSFIEAWSHSQPATVLCLAVIKSHSPFSLMYLFLDQGGGIWYHFFELKFSLQILHPHLLKLWNLKL